jgi:hypothetical protein
MAINQYFIFSNHPTCHAYFKHIQVYILVFHISQSHSATILTIGLIQICKTATEIVSETWFTGDADSSVADSLNAKSLATGLLVSP